MDAVRKRERAALEWAMCRRDVRYFINSYVRLFNAGVHAWTPFTLWPQQTRVLEQMCRERLLVILKARQLGLSWLCLAYALWMALFQGPATVLLFSLREVEAVELLARLKEMHSRLPAWLRARSVCQNAARLWALSNGSRVIAFSTRGGRSYTGNLAIVDEADHVPDLAVFLNAIKPTVDGGGKLFLVSTSDKRRPLSTFKNIFRAAMAADKERQQWANGQWADGERAFAGDYRAVFLPWHAHPERTLAWYERVKAEMFAQRGNHDDFYAEYPASAEEALAPEQLDRRIPYDWLKAVVEDTPAVWAGGIPGLTVYELPRPGRRYVIGADPAEGNPNSDESAACVLDAENWAQAATLAGKLEPGLFAHLLSQTAAYFNQADVLVERNNHGHSVIRALAEEGAARVLDGYDGRPGWLSNQKGKLLLYDALAQAVRDGVCRVRCAETAAQLASIEASTLRAPAGLRDDRADAFGLAVAALVYGHGQAQPSTVAPASDPLQVMDRSREW